MLGRDSVLPHLDLTNQNTVVKDTLKISIGDDITVMTYAYAQ